MFLDRQPEGLEYQAGDAFSAHIQISVSLESGRDKWIAKEDHYLGPVQTRIQVGQPANEVIGVAVDSCTAIVYD